MSQNLSEENLIRGYFLGDLPESEQERVEERLFTDREFFETSLVIEDELVDDYALGLLPARERRKLERRFLITPQQYRRVKLARNLGQYLSSVRLGTKTDSRAIASGRAKPTGSLFGSVFSRLVTRKRSKTGRKSVAKQQADWESHLADAQANRNLVFSLIADDWMGLQLLTQLRAASPATHAHLIHVMGSGDADLTATLARLIQCGLVYEHRGEFSCSKLGVEMLQKLEEISKVRLSVDSM
jgi:anti-sigma-K factor RskA